MKPLTKTWNAFKTNKKYLAITIILELLFLFAIVQTHYVFFKPTTEIAGKMMEAMSTTIDQLADSEVYQLESKLQQNPEFMQAYNELLKYLAYFFLTILAIWIAIRGPVWWLSLKSIHKKMPLTTTWLKFSLLSIFWFIVLLATFILYSTTQGINFNTALTITAIAALLAILYFSEISFSLIPSEKTFKNTFMLGVKHARNILPAFIINLILTAVAIAIPFIWIKTIPLLSLAIITFITIPAIAFARLHIIITTWQKR